MKIFKNSLLFLSPKLAFIADKEHTKAQIKNNLKHNMECWYQVIENIFHKGY